MYHYSGKRVAVLGLSVEGRNSVSFFTRHGARVTVLDRRTEDQFSALIPQLKKEGVTFRLGDGYLADLSSYDVVVRSPGISLRLPEVAAVAKTGKLTSQTKMLLAHAPCPVIGITGTKGKGTTSTLISHMLKADGLTVWLGGNVGVPLLSELDAMHAGDWAVLELSSFQLEDCDRSPHIAVVLRITQDHLANFDSLASSYHATREEYVDAKKNIVSHQKASDIAILDASDETSSSFALSTPATIRRFNRFKPAGDAFVRDNAVYAVENGEETKIVDASEIQLRGAHNLENIAAATLAARSAGVSYRAIREAAIAFRGLEHRLEFVREVNGVSYYNDSFSTVPETTVAAIESFDRPIVLIVGGSEKMSDFRDMGRKIAQSNVKTLIVIGQMTQRILSAVTDAGYRGQVRTGLADMHDIVQTAMKDSSAGDIVLLSPACASFDMFHNYKERGTLFKHEVGLL